ncbi:MAG: endolytic transglycosylase MltG, partial [Ruminococcus sp.]|nr:endolytic transglycosylase MltG [Candidatus Copronaster equi]
KRYKMKDYKKLIAIFSALAIIVSVLTSCSVKINLPSKKNTTTYEAVEESTLPLTVKVTIPEGYTVLQIAQRLEENHVCSKSAFLELCKRPIEGFNLENTEDRYYPVEGYLFPDTYEFYSNTSPQEALNKFIENYKVKITDEYKTKAEKLGYTMDEMLTLASIIQKECDKDIAECQKVSAVFHNRLKSPDFPTLGSDVTTFYITKNLGELLGYNSNVEMSEQNADVRKYIDLYSTYYCKGLPVGPICNPGTKAIEAALNPSDEDYYYFLTDPSGEHFYYAKTDSEHQANAREAGLY